MGGIALVGSLLAQTTARTETSIQTVRRSIEVPLGHLTDALRAETDGETLLQRAATATGEDRSRFLAESIAKAETTSKEWTRYKATAMGLPGEAELAARYERDYVTAKAVAAEILVPIIQSNTPAPLPDAQVVAAERDRRDLQELIDLYRAARASELTSLQARVDRAHGYIEAGVQGGLLLAIVAGGVGLRAARRAVALRRRREDEAATATFEGQLIRALELARDDDAALHIAATAVAQVAPQGEVAIAALPAGGTTLEPVIGSLVCGVSGPGHCPALRSSAPLLFADSEALDTCPVLALASDERCAAACSPISVGGTDAAVLQVVGPVEHPPDPGGRVNLVVRRVGERLTIMRAFARFELQASRDPLTGLLNRRSLTEALAQLTADGIPFTVAFADLDHFKQLNDQHGHEAGDRALRSVARSMRDGLRPRDLLCRWGGEEFVIVLPDCSQIDAVEAMERMRARVAWVTRNEKQAVVTVSVGVAEAEPDEAFETAVARADAALLAAKAAGRDQVVVWAPGMGSMPIEVVAPPGVVPG